MTLRATDRADVLRARAEWAARAIADAPPLAVQGTLRAIWAAQELSRRQAVDLGCAFVAMGTDQESLRQRQAAFTSGKRLEPRLR